MRVLKAIHQKGASLSQLARANLSFDGQYIGFDGQELRAYRDAAQSQAGEPRTIQVTATSFYTPVWGVP